MKLRDAGRGEKREGILGGERKGEGSWEKKGEEGMVGVEGGVGRVREGGRRMVGEGEEEMLGEEVRGRDA